MIIKFIGGLMVLAACGLFGISAANRFRNRTKEIRRFRSSIQMLETEIIFGCTPLPYALKNISNKVEGALINFYSMISEDLLIGESNSLEAAWSKGSDMLIKNTCLKKSDVELISDFGKVLGNSDREDQKKHFELFYIQFKQNEEASEEERNKNEKMYKTLGFLSGLVIFILLL